jgi:type II secretory pathway pseudopilin PulG
MAALLVMLTIMSILMTVVMPVWRQQAQREKEEELVFRGQQYVRAIRLYQMKNQSLPPSVDVLVQGRYIRKKYKDPITDEDFVPLGAAQGAAGQVGQQPPVVGQPGGAFAGQPGGSFPGGPGPAAGGVIGVASKSKGESIRLYQGRTHYNEWAFVFVNAGPGGVPGQPQPGGPGGQQFPGRGGRGGVGGPQGPIGGPTPFPGGGGGRGRGGTIPSIERPGAPTPTPFPGRGGRGGL